MVTRGDSVADNDVIALLGHHRSQGRLVTVTAVRPGPRFGELAIADGRARVFQEKPQGHTRFARENQLAVYLHGDFWQFMDTFREFQVMKAQWDSGDAPLALWR